MTISLQVFSHIGEPMRLAGCVIDNWRTLGISPADTLYTLEIFFRNLPA